jgi:hypothetical protein
MYDVVSYICYNVFEGYRKETLRRRKAINAK